MITITRTTTGIRIQRDDVELHIDGPAIAQTLAPILLTLIDAGKVVAQARREGYEAGLLQGHAQGRIEAETQARIAAQTRAENAVVLGVATLAA